MQDYFLLSGRNNRYYAYNDTPTLSIKTMSNGHAIYEIEGGRFAVGEDSYLILNHGQQYTIEIESPLVVESFCVFFPEMWAADVLNTLTKPADMESLAQPREVHFFERLYRHDALITPAMRLLHRRLREGSLTQGQIEETLHDLLAKMLHVQYGVYREAERLPAAKHSTRLELYQRLYRARDYMDACLDQPLTLESIAKSVYLSPYHFLRAFKQLFGITPHTYLTQRRLERARFLIARTDVPITDICFTVGFESLSSFSLLFRKATGCSPREYRKVR